MLKVYACGMYVKKHKPVMYLKDYGKAPENEKGTLTGSFFMNFRL